MKTGTFVIVPMCVCIIVSGCGDRTEKPKAADGSGSTAAEVPSRIDGDEKREPTKINQDTVPQKNAAQKGENMVNSEQQAIEIAKRAVKESFTKYVPENAELEVKLIDGRYEIAFLRPLPKVLVPSSGYYVLVRVDAKDGTPTVLGEP